MDDTTKKGEEAINMPSILEATPVSFGHVLAPSKRTHVKGGLWVTFEGGEGSGKTTQLDLLERRLDEERVFIYRTKQPGGKNPLGLEVLRPTVLGSTYKEYMNPFTEMCMFFGDRAVVRFHEIYPVLDNDGVGLIDRETDSTKAYQCFARGLPLSLVDDFLRMMDPGGRKPDLTILYDGSPEELLPRAHKRNGNDAALAQESRFDDEKIEFHRKVRNGYLTLARQEPERFVVLDALQPIETLHELTYAHVLERAARKGIYQR
ncbi:TPA: dTMP kinase [Candidatus Woesearchaeota archaeon]|nr:dTMP kinase [Candidatus Woesearchaeota archaeon]